MKKPETIEEKREWLRQRPEAWAEYEAMLARFMSRAGDVMWRCVAMHMEMRAEGTGASTAVVVTSTMYKALMLELDVEMRREAEE